MHVNLQQPCPQRSCGERTYFYADRCAVCLGGDAEWFIQELWMDLAAHPDVELEWEEVRPGDVGREAVTMLVEQDSD